MKKLSYLIVLVLISGLALVGCVLFNPITPSLNLEKGNLSGDNGVCIDLAATSLNLSPGDSIEGAGTLLPYLTIFSTGNVVVLQQGVAVTDTWTYGTGSGYNGCISTLNSEYGFGDLDRNHDYTFTFTSGVTVNSFSLRMLDFGDYFPLSTTPHSIQMTAYDAYNNIIDFHLLEIDGGKDLVKGDACTAVEGEPGKYVFEVNGPGIVRVEIQPVSSIDPNIGFNDICFTQAICETKLIAGQNQEVGDVIVKYLPDGNLGVTYKIDDPWLMDEIHFHAASAPPPAEEPYDSGLLWPLTKKGNPIPGHFDYIFEDLEGDDRLEKTFTIPIPDGELCGDLYFAAHAKVYNPEEYETLWQIGDVEEKICGTIDIPLFSNYADEFNWVGADTCTLGPGLSVNTPPYTDPFIIGETPDSLFPFNSNAVYPTLEPYAANFNVQWDGEIPFGGRLILSWAPGTGTEVKQINISDNNGNSYSFTEDDSNIVAGKDESIFNSVLVENILEFNELKGEINFNFVQTSGNGTAWDWIRLEKYREETAWGEGYGFPGAKNWSMYFECDNLLPDCSE